MTSPAIKREESLERPLTAVPSKRKGTIATLFAVPPPRCSNDDDAKPLLPSKASPRPNPSRASAHLRSKPPVQVKTETLPTKPANVAADLAAPAAPATHREVLPRDLKIGGAAVAVGRPGAQKRPVFSSQPISALATPQQTAGFTKTHPYHHILADRTLTRLGCTLRRRYIPQPQTRRIARTAAMEGFNFDNNADGGSMEGGMNELDAYTGVLDVVPEMVTMTRDDFNYQQNYIQILQNSNTANQHDVAQQRAAIAELAMFNRNMCTKVHELDVRVTELERDNAYLQAQTAGNAAPNLQAQALGAAVNGSSVPDGSDRSPLQEAKLVKSSVKRSVANAFDAEGVTMPGRTKYRKKLEVKIPGKAGSGPSGLGLPTPVTSALQTAPSFAVTPKFPTTPRTPYTPGRIGPPDSYKKSTTSINKRDIHNLNKSIPPVNVQLPMVPLTDTEVIVYFFNSLSRPIVSLRLYARGWGPASIVQALNDHRVVEPPYLRNTCSVKCTTAIKNGKKLYGDEWEPEYRATLAEAEDARATDLIRADEDDTCDYYVRALAANLKQHPTGECAGIFTRCVKYCVDNDASWTMSNVHQLAFALHQGNVPERPDSPDPCDVCEAPQTVEAKQGDDTEANWTEDEYDCTPSPLAKRKSNFTPAAGPVGFTAVNPMRSHNDDAED